MTNGAANESGDGTAAGEPPTAARGGEADGAAAWLGCAFFAGFAAFALYAGRDLAATTRFGPGPGFFVRGLAFAMLALALVQALGLVFAGRRGAAAAPPGPDNASAILRLDENAVELAGGRQRLARFALLAASLFAYGLLLERLGFVVATAGLSFAAMVLLGRPPLRSAAESVAAVLVAFVLFGTLLGVNLPGAGFAPLAALGL